MKNYKIILLVFIIPVFLSGAVKQSKKPTKAITGKWGGRVSFYEKLTDPLLTYEWRMDATITNDTGTVIHSYNSLSKEHGCTKDCSTAGPTELELDIDMETKEYGLRLPVQGCSGISRCKGNSNQFALTDETAIVIEGQPLGSDPNVLSGTLTETNGPDRTGAMTVTTYTWNLARGSIDAELIVTPSDYNNWLPVPGPDESTQGSVMNIELKVQDRNGQKASLKAKSFELRLSNTSSEPGITLNFPLSPSGPSLPDLRFLPQAGGQISEKDQVIKIPCQDGATGQVNIGSFDGGGWTTLTAIAILENGARIQGSLLFPGGIQEILVPKRRDGSKIATAWLGANGDPGEMDDKEISKGNTNDGDGLTAYEEYRGVISEGKFRRLDPNKKELGVKIKKSELSLFNEGLQKLENVTGFKVVRFYENEIPPNRRINQNASSAHSYKQFALNLIQGSLPADESGKAFGSPGIPSQVNPVTIDLNNIHRAYQDDQAEATRMNKMLPYTEKELTANVVAHELTHGINVSHHGTQTAVTINQTFVAGSHPAVRIFLYNGNEYLTRPVTFGGKVGTAGNVQSGDLTCIMVSNSLCNWASTETPDTVYFYEVPIIPLGTHLCTSPIGTGINTGGKYFGDAAIGKCVEQLKLK